MLANAASLGGDSKRVAVTGESAGGNLATVVAIKARDAGIALPVHRLLVVPVANFAPSAPLPSFAENPTTLPLATPQLAWFGKYYLADPAEAKKSARSPAHRARVRDRYFGSLKIAIASPSG